MKDFVTSRNGSRLRGSWPRNWYLAGATTKAAQAAYLEFIRDSSSITFGAAIDVDNCNVGPVLILELPNVAAAMPSPGTILLRSLPKVRIFKLAVLVRESTLRYFDAQFAQERSESVAFHDNAATGRWLALRGRHRH